MLLERYQTRVDELLREVRETQRETIIKAGKLIADTVANGGGVFLSGICHSIENDAIYRGGGPIFWPPTRSRKAASAPATCWWSAPCPAARPAWSIWRMKPRRWACT